MSDSSIDTWSSDQELEDRMNNSHAPIWNYMMSILPETDLTDATVLDFGCSQGGMLKVLFDQKPFKKGIGIDVARDAIATASEKAGKYPVEYRVSDNLRDFSTELDVVMSQEVVYVLPNLGEHAEQVFNALKPGGRYYISMGCHTDFPHWPLWRKHIAETSNIGPNDYSPAFVRAAFEAAGFEVNFEPFRWELSEKDEEANNPEWFPTPKDYVDYFYNHKLLFTAKKPA